MNCLTWFLLIVFTYFSGIAFLVPQDFIVGEIEKEQQPWSQIYETETVGGILHDAGLAHHELFVESGLTGFVHKVFIPDREEKEKSGVLSGFGSGMFAWLANRFNLMSLYCYEVICRFFLILLWIKPLCLVTLMCGLSGYWKRKIKQTNFEISSSVRERYAMRCIAVTVLIIAAVLTVPKYIDFNAVIIAWVAASVMLGVVIANLQKRI